MHSAKKQQRNGIKVVLVAYGKIYLVTDTDTAIIQGVNHALANRSDKPCMIIGVMVHPNPYPRDMYPAEGL